MKEKIETMEQLFQEDVDYSVNGIISILLEQLLHRLDLFFHMVSHRNLTTNPTALLNYHQILQNHQIQQPLNSPYVDIKCRRCEWDTL